MGKRLANSLTSNIWILVVAYALLSILDVALTQQAVNIGVTEANPLLRTPTGFNLVLKLSLTGLMSIGILITQRVWLARFGVIIMAVICLYTSGMLLWVT